MQHISKPLLLSGPLEKGKRFAVEVGYPAHVVADAGHAAGMRMRDYGAFGDAGAPQNALLVECGQHWEAASADVAREVLLRFLDTLGLLDADQRQRYLPGPKPARPRVIEVTQAVTIKSDRFRFVGDYVGLEVIPKQGTEIGRDGDDPVRTPYDDCVLIMPTRRLKPGQTAVRLGRYTG
jgi:hypothetical protein